jgi:lambda family phage portal protein
MKFLSDLKASIARILVERGFVPRRAKRGFDAGGSNRLLQGWTAVQSTPDADIKAALVTVRSRARSLAQNTDYAKRYLTLVRTNVVGPSGFKFQSNVKELQMASGKMKMLPDRVANAKIESEWKVWTKPQNCSINGRQSFRGICDQLMRYAARDGEFFCRIVRRKSLPYGIALQVIDPAAIDEQYNTRLANGNIVRMGVELDADRRPVAYYVKKTNPELEVYGYSSYTNERDRISADMMIHGFDQEFENQTRGISWLVQSMWRMKMLAGYEEAAVVNARVGANQIGFVTTPAEGAPEFAGSGEDSSGNRYTDSEPGSIQELAPGQDFKAWDTKYPNDQYESFVNANLRGISSGLGVSFNMLANNLERVNYSSIRAGLLDEREIWKLIQIWFTETFLERVFPLWLEHALLTRIDLPISRFEKFNSPSFVGKRWPWVDPKNDTEAKILEIKSGLTTRTQVTAERGDDFEEILQETAEENALAKSFGVEFDDGGAAPAPKPAAEEGDATDVEGDDVVKKALEVLETKSNGKH